MRCSISVSAAVVIALSSASWRRVAVRSKSASSSGSAVPSAIFLRSSTVRVSEPTVIGGSGSRNRGLAGSPNARSCASAITMFFGTAAVGAMPIMRRSPVGRTPEPHENTPTVSLRDQSMSRSVASSMADLPVVPLEQETWWPCSPSRAIHSSMRSLPSRSEVSSGVIGYGETVPSHFASRPQRPCVRKLSG